MKTAISLPESVFEEAEQYAHKVNKSRSQFYVMAIKEYLAHHASNNITDAMNSVCDVLNDRDTMFATTASKKTLAKESW